MLIATLQPIEVYNSLINSGVYKVDKLSDDFYKPFVDKHKYNPIFATPIVGDAETLLFKFISSAPSHPQCLLILDVKEYNVLNYIDWVNFLSGSNKDFPELYNSSEYEGINESDMDMLSSDIILNSLTLKDLVYYEEITTNGIELYGFESPTSGDAYLDWQFSNKLPKALQKVGININLQLKDTVKLPEEQQFEFMAHILKCMSPEQGSILTEKNYKSFKDFVSEFCIEPIK